MHPIAIIIATILDFPTLITLIGSWKANSLLKVLLVALIATLCGELVNTLVRPTYEPSVLSLYRLVGQVGVGVFVYGLLSLVRRGRESEEDEDEDEDEALEPVQDVSDLGVQDEAVVARELMNWDAFFGDMGRLLSFKVTWAERTTLEKAYTGVFVVMLLGLLPMPYAFYDVLRVVVCICLYFFFQVVFPQREDHRKWLAVIIALFVLYNPLIPVHFGVQFIWFVFNVLTVIILYKARVQFEPKSSVS